jgi:HEAT repeat protein
MSPLPPRTPDVSRLIDELNAKDPVRRESAAARLSVIGTRAVSRLIEVAGDRGRQPETRAAAFRALSAIGDARSAPVAMGAIGDADLLVSHEAVGVLGSLVGRNDRSGTAAFDCLAALALDAAANLELRLAAIDALEGLPDKLLKPLYHALAGDRSSRLVARVIRKQAGPLLSLAELLEGKLPDDPLLVGAAVREEGADTKVTTLRKGIDAVRDRERQVAADTAARWLAVRGLLHQALSERGSRLAVYDLREAFERATTPLPVGFVGAVTAVGDVSCLEAIATAWSVARPEDRWWRDHLADAFAAIAAREGVKRRHPSLQRILKRSPDASLLVARARA